MLMERDSRINLGDGDNQASISANGGKQCRGTENSRVETGKGNDVILLSATALGENSWINQNLYLSEYNEHDYNSHSSTKDQANTNHVMAAGGIHKHWQTTQHNYARTKSKGSNQSFWNRDYENSYIQKTRHSHWCKQWLKHPNWH